MTLGFGDRSELESTQQLAVEVGTILNASITTLRENIFAKQSLTTNNTNH